MEVVQGVSVKNGWLEYYFLITEAYFQGRTVSFREGTSFHNCCTPDGIVDLNTANISSSCRYCDKGRNTFHMSLGGSLHRHHPLI